jgi:putative SOS response-associated peptidase YedK
MCGRFTLFTDFPILQERFDFDNEIEVRPRYNIAPSQDILTVVNDGDKNKAGLLKWGLVPVWAKDKKIGYKMINARGETVNEKPSFKRLLKRRRCLIVADSFYEWKKTEEGKQPLRIKLKNDEPFGFAGLWDRWEQDGEEINSCTIITTKPNSLMEEIHDRMPVILNKESESIWLDRTIDESEYLKRLLSPFDSEQMEAFKVSTLVNSPKNDIKEAIDMI